MSDKMLQDEVGNVQSSSGGAEDPSLRDGLNVANIDYVDVARASVLNQPLWPLEYSSYTTLEHLHNRVSSHVYSWLYMHM